MTSPRRREEVLNGEPFRVPPTSIVSVAFDWGAASLFASVQ